MILKIKNFDDFLKLVENSNLYVFYRLIESTYNGIAIRTLELYLTENGQIYKFSTNENTEEILNRFEEKIELN